MKFSSILLSSAALLVAGAAYAADLPAKKAAPAAAAPSGACPAYGAGFIAIPGSDMCLKIGGYVRNDDRYTANVARPAKTPYSIGYKFNVNFDVRNNTEAGTVRSYINLYSSSSSGGATYTANSLATVAGYVELAGLRAGTDASPFGIDIGYNNGGVGYQPNSVPSIQYSSTMGATTLKFAATASEDNNDQSLTNDTANVKASRPDLMVMVNSKLNDAVTLQGGIVSHEVDGSVSGTAQGFAATGRADLTFSPITLKILGTYENGAGAYIDGGASSGTGLVLNSALGGKIKDSSSDGSNLSTGYNYNAAVEYSLGAPGLLFAYATQLHATQDTSQYNRTDYGVGMRYNVAKGMYIRPELYTQQVTINGVDTPIANVFYLRIRRDF